MTYKIYTRPEAEAILRKELAAIMNRQAMRSPAALAERLSLRLEALRLVMVSEAKSTPSSGEGA